MRTGNFIIPHNLHIVENNFPNSGSGIILNRFHEKNQLSSICASAAPIVRH